MARMPSNLTTAFGHTAGTTALIIDVNHLRLYAAIAELLQENFDACRVTGGGQF